MTKRRSALLLLVVLVLALPARPVGAEPSVAAIKLSPAVGPPTTRVAVKGRGFAPNEGISLSFDDAVIAQTNADGTGKFTTKIRVPSSALPGDHTVKATGQQSGRVGQATFTVRADWTRFHFDLADTGYNPYENVLNAGDVGGLLPKWTIGPLGSELITSPAVVGGVVYFGVGDQTFYALDADAGSVNWSRILGQYPTAPTVAGG